MQNPRLASRYAKSLLDLAVEQHQLDAVLSDVQLLDEIGRKVPEFVYMLRSPIIKADKKDHIIKAVVGGKLSPLTQSFIDLLVRKGRESKIPEILSAFIGQYQELKNIKTVKITTAAPVSDRVKEAIRMKVVGAMPDSKVEIREELNPEIIGGFILEMGDKLFDASVRRDLNDVKAQFMKNLYISSLN